MESKVSDRFFFSDSSFCPSIDIRTRKTLGKTWWTLKLPWMLGKPKSWKNNNRCCAKLVGRWQRSRSTRKWNGSPTWTLKVQFHHFLIRLVYEIHHSLRGVDHHPKGVPAFCTWWKVETTSRGEHIGSSSSRPPSLGLQLSILPVTGFCFPHRLGSVISENLRISS